MRPDEFYKVNDADTLEVICVAAGTTLHNFRNSVMQRGHCGGVLAYRLAAATRAFQCKGTMTTDEIIGFVTSQDKLTLLSNEQLRERLRKDTESV